MMWHDGYGWGMGPVGWVFMGLFWLLVIGGLVWVAVSLLPGGRFRAPGRAGRESAVEILDRRFALGEIDVEQYRQARQALVESRAGKR